MKTTAIIQARLGSKRLPKKVLAELCGKPLIWHIVRRLRSSKNIDDIILATTTNSLDDPLAEWSKENGLKLFRGSEDDVLARYYFAAKECQPDIIVRVTADDPFKDPVIIDQVIDALHQDKYDFAYNNNPPSFPEGLDTEVFTFEALEKAHLESTDPFEREHVTQYLYRHPELFRQLNLSHPKNLSHLRWTIDEQVDLEMAIRVYEELFTEDSVFVMDDILKLIERFPEIAIMNTKVKRSALYAGLKHQPS